MPRTTLPQDYILTAGTVLASFDNINDWTKGADGTKLMMGNPRTDVTDGPHHLMTGN